MLAFISGRVIAKLDDQIILKIPTGLGYAVFVSKEKNFMINENLDLFLLEIAKENKVELYGFESIEERDWVEKLMKVSGVGPKMSANIIYTIGWHRVLEAIQTENPEILSHVKGLGVKTAKKIVLELKGSQTSLQKLRKNEVNLKSEFAIDFVDTLSGLGYKRGEIVSAISRLKKESYWDEDNLVETVKRGLEVLRKS